jgi:hypothetical protein
MPIVASDISEGSGAGVHAVREMMVAHSNPKGVRDGSAQNVTDDGLSSRGSCRIAQSEE